MELGTFLPYLKIGYRKGIDNGVGDFLSRYPAFEKYVTRREDIQLPSELFDKLPESVPLFTHRLGDDDAWLEKARLELYEAKDPQLIEQIWQTPPSGSFPDSTEGTQSLSAVMTALLSPDDHTRTSRIR